MLGAGTDFSELKSTVSWWPSHHSELGSGIPLPSSGLSYRIFAAEMIGWENSDGYSHKHDTSICRCRRFDGDCFRNMGGLARQCACFALNSSRHWTAPNDGERKGTADRWVYRLYIRVRSL